jgi:hypothetical protein
MPPGWAAFMTRISIVFLLASGLAACTSTPAPAVKVEVLGRGIIQTETVSWRDDPTSSIGAKRAGSRSMRIVRQTELIPLQPGLTYGIAFRVVHAPQQVVQLRAELRTSAPCRLKTTGEVVYHNNSTLTVRVGEVRHLAATIPASATENPCEGDPLPGMDTFTLSYNGYKLSEARFQVSKSVQ